LIRYEVIFLIRRLALLIFCGLLFLSGCGGSQASQPKLKIGVSLYQADDSFVNYLNEYLQTAAKEKEQLDDIKITLNVVDAAGTQSVQNDQVDKFISLGYDVICVNMVDRTAAAVIIDKAKFANIPVVFFNREPVAEDMQRWQRAYYVGGKATQSGEIQGEILAEFFLYNRWKVDRNGDNIMQYVMLEGEPGHQDTLLRTEHSIKTVTVQYGIRVEKLANDTANWQRSQGKEKMSAWLSEFGDKIEVVFSNNDTMALGAIDALQENGYNLPGSEKCVIVAGIDAIEPALNAIKEGSLYATVLNDAKSQAQGIIDIACSEALTGIAESDITGFDGKYLLLDYRKITRESLQ
jgi:methyl-galactoside transport system substrate-binding protein